MLRLTGGHLRGRTLFTPPDSENRALTRPTQAKLRQALFNSLQWVIQEACVLDLFAGSGSLGFEALSRGASSVTFVEKSKKALEIIRKNAQILELEDQSRVISSDIRPSGELQGVLSQLMQEGPFDLILADPPYAEGWSTALLPVWPWEKLLKPDGFLCWEWSMQVEKKEFLPERQGKLVKTREKKYGDSALTTYQIKNGDEEGPSHA